jgi:hypothetical protein
VSPGSRTLVLVSLAAAVACRGHQDIYPPEVVQNFMKACTARGTQRACRCTLDAIERKFTAEEFAALEKRAAHGEQPKELMELAVDCTR